MPYSFSFQSIAELLNTKVVSGNGNQPIQTLITDSRKVVANDAALFIALVGERNNGHQYIPELYKKGIKHFIISDEDFDCKKYENANFILVKNTLDALQKIAAANRNKFEKNVVGITGSNGKTIVKEWLFQLLNEDENICRSPKSYNSQIGVPLSVWELNETHTLGIFEAGISQVGEMQKLEKIIEPTVGIFTNIGTAHAENFADAKQIVSEKMKLFQHAKQLIYCKDYELIETAIEQADYDIEKFCWSKKHKADLVVGKISKTNNETQIQGIYNNSFIEIAIPFTDEASIENAIHCWCYMLLNNYENETIKQRMQFLSPVAMRLELKEGINNCSIINDSYNSDLNSLSIALDYLNAQQQHPKRTLILSDILQTGKLESDLYMQVSELITSKKINKLIGIGEAISRHENLFTCEKIFYKSTTDFISKINLNAFENETILLKGARAFSFEDINKLLQQKSHETVLEINLTALLHNYNYFKSKLKPSTGIMAMVKAFSYGSGSFEIANLLQFHHVNYLAVAYADEGVELRKRGIKTPIMIMNASEQSFDTIINYNLEPEIYNFRILKSFAAAVKRNIAFGKQFPIHIKLDTGMHRLGFEENETDKLIEELLQNSQLKINSIFSHMVASEAVEHDSFSFSQIAQFKKMSEKICDNFDYKILLHILNSAGALRFGEAQFDMVRLGIGLYGISNDEKDKQNLQVVSSLKTTITQIKKVNANQTVGYNRKGITQHDSLIATIPIGYADGYSRKFGNGIGEVLVNGKVAKTIGNICMDMCMLDVTNIDCKEGDEVLIFGKEPTIETLAASANTIPYEILTSVSQRVKRIYYQE